MPYPSKQVSCTCQKCGKVFSVSASQAARKFCSMGCKHAAWREDGAGQRIQREEVKCETCGKTFLSKPSARRFCSNACQIVWRDNPARPGRVSRAVPRIELACEQCGATFHKLPSQILSKRGRFCSRTCLGTWTVAHREDVRESQLERGFADRLRAAGLTFETQFRFQGFAVDIAFPTIKVAVEVDGDYWHSFPKAQARDKKKDALLTAEGWRVLRLPEHLIKRDPDRALEEVLNSVT